jgi:A/G-specific adenine glycosylase
VVQPKRTDLPWRKTTDPYAILVSEVMLQQTQVERVVPRYLVARALADRRRARGRVAGDVIRAGRGSATTGAGSTSTAPHAGRARRLAGRPDGAAGRRPYTAAAVASFAFGATSCPGHERAPRAGEDGHAFSPRAGRR